ncbi:MAG: hypothetical protein PUD65_11040 [Spirochaetales bacterium]|nr:hypothetical protein [Spirochaetales bacterium]
MSIDTEDEKKENDNGGNSTSYVSKVLNNAHYNFVKDNKNFAEIVNMSLGFKLVDPETLVDCDSREIALVLDGDETDEEKELKETLVKISRELFRDNKKLGVMKSDGRYIYISVSRTRVGKTRELGRGSTFTMQYHSLRLERRTEKEFRL